MVSAVTVIWLRCQSVEGVGGSVVMECFLDMEGVLVENVVMECCVNMEGVLMVECCDGVLCQYGECADG